MLTTETKTSSTANNLIQAKRQPFFNKEGQGSFFSRSNETSQSFFSPATIQPKLTIGQPKDKYEVEADAMADKVVQRLSESSNKNASSSIARPGIQRKCSDCEEEENVQKKEDDLSENELEIQRKPIFESNAEQPEVDVQTKPISSPIIQAKCSSCEEEGKLQKKEEEELADSELSLQRKAADTPSENTSGLEGRLNSSKGGGSSLPSDIQSSMGSEFGADFSNVKVHTGSEAVQMSQDIGAQAFTHGSDIYFNQGKYDTNSGSGKHLLAHELTHTVQQGSTIPNIQKQDDEDFDEVNQIPYTCSELKNILLPIIKTSFVRMLMLDQEEDYFIAFIDLFSELLDESVDRSQIELTEDEIELLEERSLNLSDIEVNFNDLTYNYATSVFWLKDYLGLPPEIQDLGGRISYGTLFFINNISTDITYYLIDVFTDRLLDDGVSGLCPFYSLETLQELFASYIRDWSTYDGFIELEFIGSVEALIDLRESFLNPELAEDELINLGTEISRLSRYILLLDQELEPLREHLREDENKLRAGSPSELEEILEDNSSRIENMGNSANYETSTIDDLGGGIDLLKGKTVEQVSNAFDPFDLKPTNIIPDAAFPETTDNATLEMMRELSGRIDDQERELESLKEEVIPSNPSYNIEEFIQIYNQWFAFFSPSARDNDPFYLQMDTLISGIYMIMGYAGVQGGIGRSLIMSEMQSGIRGLGSANVSFSNNIGSFNPRRNERLSGSAENINYQFGEFFGDTARSRNFNGEEESREETISESRDESIRGFNEMRRMLVQGSTASQIEEEAINRGLMTSTNGGPIYLLPEERHQNLFSYLMTTRILDVADNYLPINEQKLMTQDTAQYLLAQTQYYRTLEETHNPGIGDNTTRINGIETGRASSVNTYLEGRTGDNESIDEANSLRENMTSSHDSADFSDGYSAQSLVVSRFIDDLEVYLNEYFVQNEDIAPRVLAILRISILEHKGDRAFLQHFTPAALVKALGISIAIAALVSALRFIPYIGFALSLTIGKIIKRYGIATDVGSLIAITSFFNQASDTNSFYRARTWAYFGKLTMNEIGQLLQGFAVSSVMDTFQIARTVVRSRQHSSMNEVMRDLEPLTNEPELRDILREDLQAMRDQETGAGGQNESNPRLELIDDILLRLESTHPDKMITPDIDGIRPGEGDSIIRADGTVSIGGERHGVSVTYRDGKLIIRICSDCDAFIGTMDYAIEIAQRRGLTEAEGALTALKSQAVDLQRRINSQEISVEDARPDLGALKENLESLASRNNQVDEVINIALNREGSLAAEDYLGTIRSPLDAAIGGRTISQESSRFVENDAGEIFQVDVDSIPSGTRPGESFGYYGERMVFLGDAHQRMLVEEGFSGRDLGSMATQAKRMQSHDMGVERGRILVQEEGISMVDLNPPDQYLGLFGKGIDEIGRRGNIFYILEYKGGDSQLGRTRHGTQMSAQWVGTKLAEFTINYRDSNGNPAIHPKIEQMLRAADGGRLRGRGYKTKWNETRTAPAETKRMEVEGILPGGEARYDGEAIRRAFDQRLDELRTRYGLDAIGDSVQPKLAVSQPNDKYEVEADAMADKVVQSLFTKNESVNNIGYHGNTAIQTKCDSCEEEEKLQKKEEPLANEINSVQLKPIFEINEDAPNDANVQRKCASCGKELEQPVQTKLEGNASPAPSNLPSQLNTQKGKGSPLPESTLNHMESGFGSDFQNVKIHTDAPAVEMNQSLGAQAFTHGNDIYFNEGKYDINSTSGKHLLAHELTHTVQQGGVSPASIDSVQKAEPREAGPVSVGLSEKKGRLKYPSTKQTPITPPTLVQTQLDIGKGDPQAQLSTSGLERWEVLNHELRKLRFNLYMAQEANWDFTRADWYTEAGALNNKLDSASQDEAIPSVEQAFEALIERVFEVSILAGEEWMRIKDETAREMAELLSSPGSAGIYAFDELSRQFKKTYHRMGRIDQDVRVPGDFEGFVTGFIKKEHLWKGEMRAAKEQFRKLRDMLKVVGELRGSGEDADEMLPGWNKRISSELEQLFLLAQVTPSVGDQKTYLAMEKKLRFAREDALKQHPYEKGFLEKADDLVRGGVSAVVDPLIETGKQAVDIVKIIAFFEYKKLGGEGWEPELYSDMAEAVDKQGLGTLDLLKAIPQGILETPERVYDAIKNDDWEAIGREATNLYLLGKGAKQAALRKIPRIRQAIAKAQAVIRVLRSRALAAGEKGMSRAAFRAVRQIAMEHGLEIVFRPVEAAVVRLRNLGHPGKIASLKMKTIKEIDVYLGASTDDIGKVGFYEPKLPANLPNLSSRKRKAILKKYRARKKEQSRMQDDVQKLVDDGVIEIRDGVIFDKKSGKAFTGDYDLFEIRKRGKNVDLTTLEAEIRQALEQDPISVEHGALADWNKIPAGQAENFANLVKSHRPGGEKLVKIGPDGNISLSYFDD